MEYTDISAYIQHLSYLGIFIWFAVIEQFTPIPEEISLMSTGYIAIHTGLNLIICGTAALAGLLVTDNTLFLLAFKSRKFSWKLLRKISIKLIDKVQESLRKNAGRTLFIGALIPQFRFYSPIIAAISDIRWKLFFLINGGATLFYTIIYMAIGIVFQKQLTAIFQELHILQHIVFILVMIGATIYIIFKAGKLMKKW